MRRTTIALIAAASICLSAPPPNDPILKAMVDELERSKQLKIASLEIPYYIEYGLDDSQNFTASASLGGLLGSRSSRFRIPRVMVRVGNYNFDNSNSVYTGYSPGARFDNDQWPLDNDYNLIRQQLWLATDRAYKSAVEAIALKRAALRNVTQSDPINDFAKAEPLQKLNPVTFLPVKQKEAEDRVRRLSKIFLKYPQINTSAIDYEILQSGTYYANSEGFLTRTQDRMAYLRIRASGLAPDGATIRDAFVLQAPELELTEPEAEMERQITAVADNVAALIKAPVGETYSGPVLLEPYAAAQFFGQVLGANFSLRRKPVSDPNRPVPIPASEFEGRVGSRIMPDNFTIVDDATQKDWRGHKLMGFYEVDLEGLAPKPLNLVEKGVLKAFPMTRQPMRNVEGSTGHARFPGNFGANAPYISNLFIQSSDHEPLAKLKARLIDMVKARGKQYGILIRKLDFPSSASFSELQRMASAAMQSGDANRAISIPLLVYKVYPDGKEELVRGLRFRNVNARTLRDITAASEETVVFDYLANTAPLSIMGAGGYISGVSIVSPGILLDEIELERPQEERPLLPVVPPPALTSSINAYNPAMLPEVVDWAY